MEHFIGTSQQFEQRVKDAITNALVNVDAQELVHLDNRIKSVSMSVGADISDTITDAIEDWALTGNVSDSKARAELVNININLKDTFTAARDEYGDLVYTEHKGERFCVTALVHATNMLYRSDNVTADIKVVMYEWTFTSGLIGYKPSAYAREVAPVIADKVFAHYSDNMRQSMTINRQDILL